MIPERYIIVTKEVILWYVSLLVELIAKKWTTWIPNLYFEEMQNHSKKN